MGRLLRWLVGALALAVAALLGLAAVLWWATPSPPPEPELGGEIREGRLEHEGLPRRWLRYVPAQVRPDSRLLFVLHGSSQTPEHMRRLTAYRFDQLADAHGFAVVYPEGHQQEWNGCRLAPDNDSHRLDLDDVGFLERVIDEESRRLGTARDRIFIAGLSNGGQMTYKFATRRPERVAAAAVLVAQVPVDANNGCRDPRGPVPMLVINGVDDPVIPFEGGEAALLGMFSAGLVQSMDGTLAHWRRVNELGDAPPVIERLPDRDPEDGTRVERRRYGGETAHPVVGYVVHGGGHAMPGGWQYGPEFLIGRTSRDFDAADQIWAFFAEREPPPAGQAFLDSYHRGCVESCRNEGAEAAFCDYYCACEVTELSRDRSPEQLEALLVRASRGGQGAAGHRRELVRVGERCVARLLAD